MIPKAFENRYCAEKRFVYVTAHRRRALNVLYVRLHIVQLPSHPRINRAALCNQVHAIGIVVGIRILCSTISTSEAKAISASYSLCT